MKELKKLADHLQEGRPILSYHEIKTLQRIVEDEIDRREKMIAEINEWC
jgi:hypothetical protein